MTLLSMTGFGAASAPWTAPDGPARIDVEIRSVNARFLELKIRQPFGAAIEQQLRARAEARMGRGRVELGVFIRRAGAGDTAAEPLASLGLDPERVHAALRAAAEVERAARALSVSMQPASAVEVLRFLLGQRPSHAEATPIAPPFLFELVDEAIGGLLAFRRTEGAALQTALLELADELERQAAALRAELPKASLALQERMTTKLQELCARAETAMPAPERVAQEIALLVAKGDIEEELARIASHIAQLREVLRAEVGKGRGKTLDFVTQELLREITTIGSKIVSHAGSRIVIEAKGTIERIREQVQNVE